MPEAFFLRTEGLSVRISGNQGISGKGVLVLSHRRPLRASRCFTIRYLYATRGHQTPGSLALQPQRAFAKLIQESSPKQFPGFRGARLCSSSRVQAGGERDASIPFRLASLSFRAAPGPATSALFYTHTPRCLAASNSCKGLCSSWSFAHSPDKEATSHQEHNHFLSLSSSVN